MSRTSFRLALTGLTAALSLALFQPAAQAAEAGPKPPALSWSFSGPFGKFDRAQLQRGFKVFKEVCASCHGASLVAFRNLSQPGGPEFTPGQVAALAATYQVKDGPNDQGEMFDRPGRAADRFPSPFPNEQAARAAQGGAYPPDFSVLAKARTYTRGFPTFVFDIFTQYQEGGPDYIYSLLTGYDEEKPAHLEVAEGTHYNPYFANAAALAMAKPISDDQVTYDDGAPQTVDQYAHDVAAFLMWAAEPHLEERKRTGFMVMVFLLIFTGLIYLTKKSVYANKEH